MTPSTTQPQGPRAELVAGWTDLWNGDLAGAERICSPVTRIRFGGKEIAAQGDLVQTPQDLADLIDGFRSTRPGLAYRVVEAYTTQTWGYCVWDASLGDLHVGGIDTFTFNDAGITHVRSITAQRPMSW